MVTSTTSATSSTSTSSTSSATSASSSDYTMFLNLLTAQVKNQDPLSPMDTTEWTNQLVQYSSVEQQIKMNTYLSTIASNSSSTSLNSAVSYIGKTVTADSDTATLSNGSASWDYTLASDASKVTVTIKNSDGTTVYSNTSDGTSSGTNSYTWDGKDASGNTLADGDYTLSVSATDSNGKAVTATTGISGTVTSATTDSDGNIVLKVGNSSVLMSKVTSVS